MKCFSIYLLSLVQPGLIDCGQERDSTVSESVEGCEFHEVGVLCPLAATADLAREMQGGRSARCPTLRPLTRLTAGRDVVGYPPTVIRASHASHKETAVRISHSRLVPPRFPEGGRTEDKQRDVWLIFLTAAVGVAAAVSGAGPPAV